MRLIAFYGEEDIRTGRIEGDEAVVGGGPLDPTGHLGEEFADAIGWDATGPEERFPLEGLEAAPIILAPTKIVCVGLNYREHAAEGGREAPARPLLFAKFSNTIVGSGDPVVRPEGTHALDLEVELGVVMGRRARRVTRANAMDHVAGYIVVNDISARDWQGNPQALREGEKGDGQWLRAKGSDTFLPIGPMLVTTDEVDPAAGLRLRSWRIDASGLEHLMQDGTTADLVHDVRRSSRSSAR